MSYTVLISGATGKQGGGVVDALLATKILSIRALTRSPDSPAAQALRAKGVEPVKGSFSDEASLVKALNGVSAAFLVTEPLSGGAAGEILQGKTFVDAAKKAGVRHIVFTSVGSADKKTGIPHFDSKFEIEEYIRASGLDFTFIRPVSFYENLPLRSGMQTFLVLGLFEAALRGKKLQWVSVKDIGWFGARALENLGDYKGRAIELAGDNLTISEVQDRYAAIQGFRPWRAWIPGFAIGLLPGDFQKMLKWFYSHGYEADISSLRRENEGLLSFADWLKQGKSQ